MEFDIERSLKNFGDNILVFGNDLAVKVSYRNFDMKRGRNCVKYSKEFQAGSTDSRRYLFLIGALFMPPPPPPPHFEEETNARATPLSYVGEFLFCRGVRRQHAFLSVLSIVGFY